MAETYEKFDYLMSATHQSRGGLGSDLKLRLTRLRPKFVGVNDRRLQGTVPAPGFLGHQKRRHDA